MAMKIVPVDHWSDGKRIHVVGYLLPSGNYVAGGDTIDMTDPAIKTGVKGPIALIVPFYSPTGDLTYQYSIVTTVTPLSKTNCKLKVIVKATGLELAAGAYPAGVITNFPGFYGIFHKMV